jgi:hypothetical protein
MKKVTKYTAIVAALVLLGSAVQTFGMAEGWGTYSSRFLTLQGGTTGVAQGALVKLGILTTTEADMIANQNNITFLNANFSAWATSTVGDATGLDGSWTTVTTAPGAGYFSQTVYLLAFNAPTVGAANQVGLFKVPGNVFPANDGAAQGGWDLGDANIVALIGALSSGTVTSPGDLTGTDAASLHLVPEPSSIALAGLGILGLIGLIRRRS